MNKIKLTAIILLSMMIIPGLSYFTDSVNTGNTINNIKYAPDVVSNISSPGYVNIQLIYAMIHL